MIYINNPFTKKQNKVKLKYISPNDIILRIDLFTNMCQFVLPFLPLCLLLFSSSRLVEPELLTSKNYRATLSFSPCGNIS